MIRQIESLLRDLRLSLKHLAVAPSRGYIDWSVMARGLWAAGRVPDAYDPFTILGVIVGEIVKQMRPSGNLPQTVAVPEETLQYTGPVYVRPIGRGLVLQPDAPDSEEHLSDVLCMLFTHGNYNMEITIRALLVEESG